MSHQGASRGLGSIRELHSAYLSGSLSVEQVLEEHLAIAERNAHGAFITVTSDAARRRASELQKLLQQDGERYLLEHPLFGVPVGLKDNIQYASVRTTCASRVLENYVSPYTATAVEQLLNAGAMIVGKQNLDEFAMGGTGLLSAFGPVSNPIAPGRIVGGSSSGSAASVAEGSSWLSLGSDTGGSVRLPAAYCGLSAFKPTYGTVSRFGLIAYASSLDQISPIARSIEDLERVYRVVGGFDPRDATSQAISQVQLKPKGSEESSGAPLLRVGIPSEAILAVCEPAIRDSFQDWADSLRRTGHRLIEVSLPSSEAVVAAYYVIALGEASSNLSRFDGVRYGVRPEEVLFEGRLESFHRSVRALFGSEVQQRLLIGTHVLSAGYRDQLYLQACRMRQKLWQDFSRTFSEVDCIATPVSTRQAPQVAGMPQLDRTEVYMNDAFTVTANLAGIPAVVLPVGTDSGGLPFGVQLLGASQSDLSLLRTARLLKSQANGWEKV